MNIGIIHAKQHSTRVPFKNTLMLGNKPLFCHILDTALKSTLLDKVVIDSDSDEILSIGKARGAETLKRPNLLATNDATGDNLACWGANNYPNSDIIVSLLPTSPFITSTTINEAVTILKRKLYRSVTTIHKQAFYQWKNKIPLYLVNNKIPNSYSIEEMVYETTGLYASITDFILLNYQRLDYKNTFLLPVSKIEAIDINTEEDFKFAEIVYRGLQ